MNKLRVLLAVAALTALAETAAAQPPAAADRPNVIVVLADDLGYNDTDFPNMNGLKNDGVTFTNGYAASPLCSPARAGIITGVHPAKLGLLNNIPHDEGLTLDVPTLADRLKELGYVTAMIGKWHLGADEEYGAAGRGFDYAYTPVTAVEMFDRLRHTHYTEDGEYFTDLVTDRAIDFIEQAPGPFFLYLSHQAPHVPLQAPHHLVQRYSHVEDENRRTYLAMVASLDDNLGRLTDHLKRRNLYANTMIFFLSDNGGAWRGGKRWADNHPLRAGKETLFEGGIRVPFIGVYPAGWPRGVEYHHLASGLDLFPTILAEAGGTGIALDGIDGIDLGPYVAGGNRPDPARRLYWELDAGGPAAQAERVGTTKTIHVNGKKYVYDLSTNPGEHDLLPAAAGDRSAAQAPVSWYVPVLAALAAGERGAPAASAAFDLYFDAAGAELIYHKEPCAADDLGGRFYLQVFPVDPGELDPDRRQAGFHDLDFGFRAHGVLLRGGACVALAPLPAWEHGIARIYTSQVIGREALWQAEFRGGGWSVEFPAGE